MSLWIGFLCLTVVVVATVFLKARHSRHSISEVEKLPSANERDTSLIGIIFGFAAGLGMIGSQSNQSKEDNSNSDNVIRDNNAQSSLGDAATNAHSNTSQHSGGGGSDAGGFSGGDVGGGGSF